MGQALKSCFYVYVMRCDDLPLVFLRPLPSLGADEGHHGHIAFPRWSYSLAFGIKFDKVSVLVESLTSARFAHDRKCFPHYLRIRAACVKSEFIL